MGRVSAGALLLAGFAAVAGAQTPRIDSIDPARGPIAGGTLVTILGSGFDGTSVDIDSVAAVPTSRSDTRIQVQVPPHANGYALLRVSAPAGAAFAEFLYVPPMLRDLPPGSITTVAGVGARNGFSRLATKTNVQPWGLGSDGAGNVDVVSAWLNRVFRVTAVGLLEPFIGDGSAAYDVTDGLPAASAHLSFPRSIGLDSAGNAWVSDAYHTIRRMDATTGTITTVCGTSRTPGFSGDGGPAANALVHDPNFLTVAPDGTVYFLDFNNARIRRITPAGIISTVAGTGVSGSAGDGGPATEAQLEMVPNDSDSDAIAFDPRGLLYFGETRSGRVRRIDLSTGIITTLIRFPDDSGEGRIWPRIRSIAVDASGNLYVGMYTQIYKLAPDGDVLNSWGKHKVEGFSPDGTALGDVLVGEGLALAIDRNGNLLYTDGLIRRVRRFNFQTSRLETVAGNPPEIFGVQGPATGAVLDAIMDDLAFLPNGDLLFGDLQDLYIFRIDTVGEISVVAGSGTFLGASAEGHAVLGANFSAAGIDVDSAGGYYCADSGPVLYVDPAGVGHRVAGFGGLAGSGYSGDGGPALEARLTQPWDVALDRDGNIFIADTNNNRIRRIDGKTRVITTVAGGGSPLNGFEGYGHGSFCGDGGPAIDACLNTPYAVAVDPAGNLFISDWENQRIRKVDPSGVITTFAEVRGAKLAADANGVLFTNAGAVMRFRPDGRRTIVAGIDAEHGFSGDGGTATAALTSNDSLADGIAIDREGNLFFYDTGNRRIRAVRFGAVLAPSGAAAAVASGSLQSAPIGGRFPEPLGVVVRGADGLPEPSVRVDFAAPAGQVSCVFSNGNNSISVLTDRAGRAQASCRASCEPGSYEVSATPLGSEATLRFSLTNSPFAGRRSRCTRQISFRE